MTCRACGVELTTGARFCHACGTAVGDDAPTEVITAAEAEQDLQSEEHARRTDDHGDAGGPDGQPAAAGDDSQTGVVGPTLQAQVATPPPEQGTWGEFVGAIAPVVAAPRFTRAVLAALVAFAISLAAAAVASLVVDRSSTVLLPGLVGGERDTVGVLALLTMVLHQVPLTNDGDTWHNAPLLLALVPLLACAVGTVVARRVLPGSTADRGRGWVARAAPFALVHGLFLFVWSLFGAAGWHAGHLRSLLAGIVFALLGAWVAERWIAGGGSQAGADGAEPATRARLGAPARASSLLAAARTASRVLALTLLVGALGWLVGSTVDAVGRDGEGGVAEAILYVGEGGFRALGFGVLAEGEPFGAADQHDTRIYEAAGLLTDAGFIVLMLASVVPVVVGGLFSGFAIARRTRPAGRNRHALLGAVTGPVWAVAMLVAHFVVLVRLRQDRSTLTAFDGDQLVLFALVAGALLGALGGLLAADAHERGTAT